MLFKSGTLHGVEGNKVTQMAMDGVMWHGPTLHSPVNCTYNELLVHYKNKLGILTPAWLPWLQTNWRNSGYKRFALVSKTNRTRSPKWQLPYSAYNHNTLTTRCCHNLSQVVLGYPGVMIPGPILGSPMWVELVDPGIPSIPGFLGQLWDNPGMSHVSGDHASWNN